MIIITRIITIVDFFHFLLRKVVKESLLRITSTQAHNIIIGIIIHIMTDKGFINMAARISPDSKYLAVRIPPHPGHGIPVILWKGQKGWNGRPDPIPTQSANTISAIVIKNSLHLLIVMRITMIR